MPWVLGEGSAETELYPQLRQGMDSIRGSMSPSELKKKASFPWLVGLSWLEHHPINQKVTSSSPSQGTCLVAGSIPGQGTCQGCGFIPSPGTYENCPQYRHVGEATNGCFSLTSVFLFL